MPSLIGSAPNQVSTNGMLGTMAFQDADNALVQNITVAGSSSVPTKAVTDNSTASASTAFVKTAFDTRNEILVTTGISTAYVITPTIPELVYQNGDIWNVKFHTTSGVSPTLSVSGLAAKTIVYQLEDGTYSVGLPTSALRSSFTSRVRYDSSLDKFVLLDRPLSTDSEAIAGTNRLLSITPYSLRSALNASGSAPIYACRAWVKFNGTGTPSISGSGNVSSITDNGTGNYTLNFTSAMPDDTYTVVTSCGGNNATYSNLILGLPQGGLYVTTAVQLVATIAGGSSTADAPLYCAAIFR